jgi:hypothetical protein
MTRLPPGEIAMTLRRILALAIVLATASASSAKAEFGGTPGTEGFGGPPAEPVPVCRQLIVLRYEALKNGAAIGAAHQRKEELAVMCELFKGFLDSEGRFLQEMLENSARCGFSGQAVNQYRDGHNRASQIGKQVCEAAEHQRRRRPFGEDGAPFLFDGIIQRRGP